MKIQILTIAALLIATITFAQTVPTEKPAPKPKTAEEQAYDDLFKEVKKSNDSLGVVYGKLSPEQRKSSPARDSLIKKSQELSAKSKQIMTNYLQTHPESVISIKVIRSLGGYMMDPAVEEPLFNKLSKSVRESEEGKAFVIKLEKAKKLAIGQQAPLFSQADSTGKMVALSDFKGKYVLIDFWASWCAPCRAENPNVLKAYEKFKDQNFTVLGVSVDTEKARGAWIKAVKDDGMPWTQVSDLNGWTNKAADLYDIHAIPQNFLVDPKGKIVAKNIRGEQLHQTLEKILSSK